MWNIPLEHDIENCVKCQHGQSLENQWNEMKVSGVLNWKPLIGLGPYVSCVSVTTDNVVFLNSLSLLPLTPEGD